MNKTRDEQRELTIDELDLVGGGDCVTNETTIVTDKGTLHLGYTDSGHGPIPFGKWVPNST